MQNSDIHLSKDEKKNEKKRNKTNVYIYIYIYIYINFSKEDNQKIYRNKRKMAL